MSMLALDPTLEVEVNRTMTKLEAHLMATESKTYTPYYNGKMSYTMHGTEWEAFVAENFSDLLDQTTSENIFKTVVDLYAENLVPVPDELRGFSNVLVPLLTRGACPVVVSQAGAVHFPERFEMISDGDFTLALIFTRNLAQMTDYATFAYSDGRTRVFKKTVPDDFSQATREGYQFAAEERGSTLFRFALDDQGIGKTLAALQDRVNHSIIDQTVIAEMYARPFWYLLNVQKAPENPYLPKSMQPNTGQLTEEKKTPGTGRVFTTSSAGPFGQLQPPTIADMISYHDSIIDKIPQSFGVPAHYLKPGSGTPPTGVALKVLSKRFNNRVARIREDLEPELERLCELLGVERTVEVKTDKPNADDATATNTQPDMEFQLWNTEDDLLQESLDAHGIQLTTMGYPIKYVAEVVTPGVDLDDYADDSLGEQVPVAQGEPVDMNAIGQVGTPATPGQVASYANNPGQRAKVGA